MDFIGTVYGTRGYNNLIWKYDIIRCRMTNRTNLIIFRNLEIAGGMWKTATLTEFSDWLISLLVQLGSIISKYAEKAEKDCRWCVVLLCFYCRLIQQIEIPICI